jgi:hypothetical protein
MDVRFCDYTSNDTVVGSTAAGFAVTRFPCLTASKQVETYIDSQ